MPKNTETCRSEKPTSCANLGSQSDTHAHTSVMRWRRSQGSRSHHALEVVEVKVKENVGTKVNITVFKIKESCESPVGGIGR